MSRGTRTLQAAVKEETGLSQWGTQRRPQVVATLRAAHHKCAQLIAGGMKYVQVAHTLGMTPMRIQQLLADPTFQNLVAEYRALDQRETGDYLTNLQEVVMANALQAELQIQTKLQVAEEEGETLPVRDLISISRDGADRLGLGKRSVQTNINMDFAAMLEKAVQRSAKVRVIEGVVAQSPKAESHRLGLPSPPVPNPTVSQTLGPLESSSPAPSGGGMEERETEVTPSPPRIQRRF